MALTAEDVVNKRFQPTKFREGYDQDEVDDFLDEVVVELRRLTQENEQLKQSLSQSEEKAAQLERDGSSQAAASTGAPPAAEPEPVSAPIPAAAPAAAAPSQPSAAGADETADTNNLLQLARRLHEEHVREGKEKRDALIAEGHSTAAQIVSEAEEKQRAQISSLDQEKEALEKQIDELRTFERDYRASLKDYIQGQLRDLESSQGSSAPAAPAQTATSGVEGSSAPFSGFGG